MVLLCTLLALLAACLSGAAAPLCFEGGAGPGRGKQVVLLAGDEEYRSEEAMPMLAEILAKHHGFRCQVLFALDPERGEIDPNAQRHLPGMAALDTADLVIMALRFRQLPDAEMRHFVRYVEAGKPLIALRTSTHAFNYPAASRSRFAHWSFRSRGWDGGFGRQILGETWVRHHGEHGVESTRGVVVAPDHPLMRGVDDVWGDTDVYAVGALPADATVLMRGQVLAGMAPTDRPVAGRKNEPMMPVAWVRERSLGERVARSTGPGQPLRWQPRPTPVAERQKVIVTTLGAATDFEHPGLRRFVVNAAYWATGLGVPAELEIEPIRRYAPSPFGMDRFLRGRRPEDWR